MTSLAAPLLGLLHLVRHLVGHHIQTHNLSINLKFTSVAILSRFSCMVMSARVRVRAPRRSRNRRQIRLPIFLGSLTSTTSSLEGLRATDTKLQTFKCIYFLVVAGFVKFGWNIFVHVVLDISVTIKSWFIIHLFYTFASYLFSVITQKLTEKSHCSSQVS